MRAHASRIIDALFTANNRIMLPGPGPWSAGVRCECVDRLGEHRTCTAAAAAGTLIGETRAHPQRSEPETSDDVYNGRNAVYTK